MTKAPVSVPHPIAPDHNDTLVLAIELSNKSWVLAAQVPDLARVKAKRTIEPTAVALLAALQGYRERAKVAGRHVERVIATYETGWSGFWLAKHGVETHVVQPSSVLVDRRADGRSPMGSTRNCCCVRCWPGFAANHVCARWFRSPPKATRMPDARSAREQNLSLSGWPW